jgi:hypothetical protein
MHDPARRCLLAMGVALAMVVSACGDEGSSSATPTTAASPTSTTLPFSPTTAGSSKSSTTTVATATTPVAGTWRAIAPAPVVGRNGVTAVWTGTEMVVTGGVTADPGMGRRAVGDGAAYDPATDAWRTIAPAPMGTSVAQTTFWTGSDVLLWAGNSPDGPAVGAIYDTSSDSWRAMAKGPLGSREEYASAWTGRELVIVGGSSGDGVAQPIAGAYDSATDAWRTIPDPGDLPHFGQAVWTGREVLLEGSRLDCVQPTSTCQDRRRVFVAYDPTTDSLRTLAAAPAGYGRIVAWTGSRVLWLGADATGAALHSYDPVTDAWTDLADPPCAPEGFVGGFGYQSGFAPLWTGDELMYSCDGLTIVRYRPYDGGWTTDSTATSPLTPRTSGAVVWTGADVLVWSGIEQARFGPTPNDGAAYRPARSWTA